MQVELDPNEDNQGNTWLPCVYLGEIKPGSHMVKYKSSNNVSEKGFQKVLVPINRIRPYPPKVENRDFDLLEKVDALYNSFWTVGVIIKVLVGKRYTVKFKHLRKEVEFDYSKIRPHMDWIDGRWVSESKGLVFTFDCQEQFMRKCDTNKSIEIITLDDNSCSLNESTSTFTPDDADEGSSYKHVEQKESKCPNEKQVNHTSNDGKSPEVVPNGNEKRTAQQKVGEINNHASISAEKIGMPPNSQLGSFTWLRKRKRSRLSKSIFQNLQSSAKFVMDGSALEEASKEISLFLEDNVIEAGDTEASEPVMEDCGLEAAEKEASEPVVRDRGLYIPDKETSDPVLEDGAVKDDNREFSEPIDALEGYETSGTVVGPKDIIEIDTENSWLPSVENDKTGMSGELYCVLRLPELPTEKLLPQMATGSQSQVSPVSTHLSADDRSQAEETNSPKNAIESGETEATDTQTLQFAKDTPIWQCIESMEVFRKYPQSPHFRPLLKYKENEHEGWAFCHMINYANLMVKISKLQPNDPTKHIDSLVEMIGGYAELGFDVEMVWGRLNEWRNTKAEIEKLEDESKGIATTIKECISKKTRIDEEVAEINHRIAKLKRKQTLMTQVRTEHRAKLTKLSLEAEAICAELLSARESSRSLVAAIIPR